MLTVIFDLDGTLIDSSTDIAASINYVRKRCYGLEPLTPSRIVELMNRPGLNLAYEFYGVAEYESKAREIFEEHYSRQCLLNARTFDGIFELLETLRDADAKMFVATNAPTKTSQIILGNNKIDTFFEDIVGADRVEYPKPHPQMIERIVGSSAKDRCWMVGDSPNDIMAATGAGVRPIFARWGFAKDEEPDIAVEYVADIPTDVADIIAL